MMLHPLAPFHQCLAIAFLLMSGFDVMAAESLDATLEPIRKKRKLPALAAAVVQHGETTHLGAVGVRKIGDPTPVTIDDQFHLGSCTKAMTATLVAMLIEDGKLTWDTTISQGLPSIGAEIHPDYRDVTIAQLLTNRGGVTAETSPKGKSLLDVHQLTGSNREQRQRYVQMILAEPPSAKPGTKYIYSNAGYTIAGAMAEQAAQMQWEDLLRERIFKPLMMTTAGFGAMGTPEKIDQPRQHQAGLLRFTPVEPSPLADNPVAIGPAGLVHCSIGDWAKFAAAHLRGERDAKGLVSHETFQKLHSPPDDLEPYAMGWAVLERDWAKGFTLVHNGSNTMNFSVVWIAPQIDFAVLVCCNAGGSTAEKACDEVASSLIKDVLRTF